MRRRHIFAAVLAAGFSAAVAGAAPVPLVVAKGPIVALAASGGRVAFAPLVAGGTCDRVFVWQDSPRRTFQLGRKQRCASVHGVTQIAVSGDRALWLAWNGPKIREWRLWTATTTARTPHRLALASQDPRVDPTPPIVAGSAGGGLLPYAVESTVTVLRANGTTAFTWAAPARVTALAATGGRIAVADEGSRVTVLDQRGKTLSVDLFVGGVSAVAFTQKGLLVQRGAVLELRRGADAHEIAIFADARLEGVAGKRAVWSDGVRVHVIRLPDGAQTAAFNGSHAALVGKRLYVASGSRITLRAIR